MLKLTATTDNPPALLARILTQAASGRADCADVIGLVLAAQDKDAACQGDTALGQALLAFDQVLPEFRHQEALRVLQRAATEPGPPPGPTTLRALLGMRLADIAALNPRHTDLSRP